ncbi:dihydroorotase [Ureibacillus aquaedulcis]|uniref:Amidohydrolase family protein n=1 Tax=Ureibacillus aquaedulcis TaxID=3058421 RepID=A0ABT8GL69_9BACL|nr:amidohydrolase family protein [Ureibacillus sp. BA0131]MDN4491984.1 amidohydrolase family protein [Ureibacillus sp. BA0131]
MLDLLIKNGEVVFPRVGVQRVNIGIKDEKVVGIYGSDEQVDAQEVIDAQGLHVFPGIIDAHQHLGIYNSIEDDFLDTKQHALAGITTIVNFDRQPVSYLEWFPTIKEDIERWSYIDFSYSLGILTEQHLDELEELVNNEGITSFKFFRNYERQLNDKFKITNGIDLSTYDLGRILQRLNEISPKLLLAVHCENMDINRNLTKQLQNSGENEGLQTWSKTSPGYAEAESLLSTLYINKIHGGNLYVVHLTSGDSVEVLENSAWLTEGNVKIETCPHYLVLDDQHEVDIKAKVGPPIHSKQDAEKLWEGIRNGLINAIGTDHVPCNLETKLGKRGDTWDTLFGFPSAGGLLPLMLTEGYKKRGIPLERIADIMSLSLAESYNLPSKGRIEVGADADFAIVNLQQTKPLEAQSMSKSSDFSLYEGFELCGWPVYTISRGEIIVAEGQTTKESGRGKFIYRNI